MSSGPSLLAGVTFQKYPAVGEIREGANFIFFLQIL